MAIQDRKIWTIDFFQGEPFLNLNCRAVVIWEAVTADEVFDMFVDVCERLNIDPDDYPVPNESWKARTIGSPALGGGKHNVIVAFSTDHSAY